ncbi:MAG TPA: hypothetical protein VNG33_11150 [Polyangiaceae bacterium]|nr:hypothetical protein [Polyangiaceae bacterium]
MSAVVVRELVAQLGLTVDEAAFKKADAGLDRVKKGLEGVDGKMRDAKGRFLKSGSAIGDGAASAAGASAKAIAKNAGGSSGIGAAIGATLGKYIGGAAVVSAIAHMTELASSADETNNVLQQVFGAAGEAEVHQWAETAAREMGRSKYALEANAGALGAMLEPMTGNAAKAQEMSTRFAGLAVDLASFFNATDDDALAALKSGISGESEPLKKFGIVMQDATLQEYAHKEGIEKKFQAMSVAEKTELRYAYILSQTTKAQGDATRTADGFANRQRALSDSIRDLATDIGKKFLPVATKMLGWVLTGIKKFGELTKTTHVLKAAMVVLGVVLLSAFGPAALTIGIVAAQMLLLVGVVEDLMGWFDGDDSAFGDFLDNLFGDGSSAAALAAFKEALGAAEVAWNSFTRAVKNFPWEETFQRYDRRIRVFGETLKLLAKQWRYFFGATADKPITDEESQDIANESEEAAAAGVRRLRSDAARAKRLAREAEQRAAAQRQLEAEATENRGRPDLAYSNPFASYAGGASLSAPLPPPTTAGTTVNQPLNITNILPPNANVTDFTRAQQRAADIQLRRAQDALGSTAP